MDAASMGAEPGGGVFSSCIWFTPFAIGGFLLKVLRKRFIMMYEGRSVSMLYLNDAAVLCEHRIDTEQQEMSIVGTGR